MADKFNKNKDSLGRVTLTRKEEKSEKYTNSKFSRMDMKIDKMMNHKKGKK